jgi:hypothetical protein
MRIHFSPSVLVLALAVLLVALPASSAASFTVNNIYSPIDQMDLHPGDNYEWSFEVFEPSAQRAYMPFIELYVPNTFAAQSLVVRCEGVAMSTYASSPSGTWQYPSKIYNGASFQTRTMPAGSGGIIYTFFLPDTYTVGGQYSREITVTATVKADLAAGSYNLYVASGSMFGVSPSSTGSAFDTFGFSSTSALSWPALTVPAP